MEFASTLGGYDLYAAGCNNKKKLENHSWVAHKKRRKQGEDACLEAAIMRKE
jgi:hypothetical protein